METNFTEGVFDAVVVGSGHAGVEAALALARTGMKTALLTLNLDSIGFMPCNPSIGGTAKGNLVRELDALGGETGIAADKAALQMRMLNRGKGAAVHSLRGQEDKNHYHRIMKQTLEMQENLRIVQCEASEILVENGYTDELWDYPLSEIDHIVENKLDVVLVDCVVYNEVTNEFEHMYRWFEVPEDFEEEE
jgi:tRNA uridine 5-carboxymethylaminomethyl modification enzyme